MRKVEGIDVRTKGRNLVWPHVCVGCCQTEGLKDYEMAHSRHSISAGTVTTYMWKCKICEQCGNLEESIDSFAGFGVILLMMAILGGAYILYEAVWGAGLDRTWLIMGACAATLGILGSILLLRRGNRLQKTEDTLFWKPRMLPGGKYALYMPNIEDGIDRFHFGNSDYARLFVNHNRDKVIYYEPVESDR